MQDWQHTETGFARFDSGAKVDRHWHLNAYAAIILDGGYNEIGFGGRRRVNCGDVIVHNRFASHCDEVGRHGAQTLVVGLSSVPAEGLFRLNDIDKVIHLAETCPEEASDALGDQLRSAQPHELESYQDWPDQLARLLTSDPSICLGAWADEIGLHPSTVSRGFKKAYGVSPNVFRAEAKAREALRLLVSTSTPLADVAVNCAYADQSHMTRSVMSLSGRSPMSWRRSNEFNKSA